MSSDAPQTASSQLPGSTETQVERPTFRVYKPPQNTDAGPSANLPDSYFTPTLADLKTAQDSLAARTQSLINAPLRTQAMRDEEFKARAAKYPSATIRVRFPDRTQLEKTFPSNDKIRSVYAFVRGSLREDVKPIKFVLYQTPPKRELRVSDSKIRDQTLLQLQLAPAAVLHLKFEDNSLNHEHVPAPLVDSVLAVAEELPRPNVVETLDTTAETPGSQKAKPSPASASSQGAAKVPKWLKLGPKK